MGTQVEVVERPRTVINSHTVRTFFRNFFLEDPSRYGYVYRADHDQCFNFVDGKPSCIVGHFFHSLGLTEKDCGTASVEHSVVSLRKSRPDLVFTSTALLMLSAAQVVQDASGTWALSELASERARSTSRFIQGFKRSKSGQFEDAEL